MKECCISSWVGSPTLHMFLAKESTTLKNTWAFNTMLHGSLDLNMTGRRNWRKSSNRRKRSRRSFNNDKRDRRSKLRTRMGRCYYEACTTLPINRLRRSLLMSTTKYTSSNKANHSISKRYPIQIKNTNSSRSINTCSRRSTGRWRYSAIKVTGWSESMYTDITKRCIMRTSILDSAAIFVKKNFKMMHSTAAFVTFMSASHAPKKLIIWKVECNKPKWLMKGKLESLITTKFWISQSKQLTSASEKKG